MSATPGPWRAVPPPIIDQHRPCIVADGSGLVLAMVLDSVDGFEANANMMAAAPVLAEALEAVWREGAPSGPVFEKVIAALRFAGRLP
jgi:hypothetical protein